MKHSGAAETRKPYDTGGPGGDCRGVRCYRGKVAEETRQACLSVLIQ